MLITNRQFSGEIPKQSGRLRNTNVADAAVNCELTSGELRAIRNVEVIKSPTQPALTLHEREGEFITWNKDVDAVDAPIQTRNWVFYTSADDVPRYGRFDDIRNGEPGLKVGVPAPSSNPIIIEGINTTTFSEGELMDSFYVCTYVNSQFQESSPSVPLTFQHKFGDEIQLGFLVIDHQELEDYDITSIRIYRSVSDVAQRVVTSVYPRDSAFFDNTHALTGFTLDSLDNHPPPAAMRGLHIMSNGIGVGFVPGEKRIVLTKNYLLHAWAYEFNVAGVPVAVTSYGNTLVVLTDGYPEIATIVNPEYIVPVQLTDREPCVSKRGVTQGYGGIFYPSASGLIHIGGGGLSRVTNDYLDQEDWDWFNPSSFNATYRDGSYYAFYDNGTRGTFVFDTVETNAVMRRLSLWGSAITTGGGNNNLYFVDGTRLLKFKGVPDKIPYLWRSSLYGDGSPFAITTRRVLSPDFDGTAFVTLRVFADGVMVHSEDIRDERVDRIEYCDRARYWYYELSGTIDVTQIDLSGSASEMHTGS